VCPGILHRCIWKNFGLMSALCTREKTKAREPALKDLLPRRRGEEGLWRKAAKGMPCHLAWQGLLTQVRLKKYQLQLLHSIWPLYSTIHITIVEPGRSDLINTVSLSPPLYLFCALLKYCTFFLDPFTLLFNASTPSSSILKLVAEFIDSVWELKPALKWA
jgi:hypothetical protein